MSMTENSGAGVWNGLSSLLGDAKGLAIDYARSKYLNAETPQDDRNVPDEADLRAGYAERSASDGTGGVYQQAIANIPVKQIALIGGLGLVALIVAKKTGVF